MGLGFVCVMVWFMVWVALRVSVSAASSVFVFFRVDGIPFSCRKQPWFSTPEI